MTRSRRPEGRRPRSPDVGGVHAHDQVISCRRRCRQPAAVVVGRGRRPRPSRRCRRRCRRGRRARPWAWPWAWPSRRCRRSCRRGRRARPSRAESSLRRCRLVVGRGRRLGRVVAAAAVAAVVVGRSRRRLDQSAVVVGDRGRLRRRPGRDGRQLFSASRARVTPPTRSRAEAARMPVVVRFRRFIQILVSRC